MFNANKDFKEEEDFDKAPYEYEKTKKVKWYDRVLLNRPLRVIIFFILAAIVAPILIYRYLFFFSTDWPPSDGHSFGSCLVQRAARLPCGFGNIPHSECHLQCCYDLDNNFCFHRFPSRFSYIMDQPWAEEVILRPRISTVPFASQNSIPSIRLSIDEITSTHLSLTFYDSQEMSIEGRRIENKDYNYRISSPELNVIVDGFNGSTIFNTARGPLIATENIWELSFRLTEEAMFGLGDIPLQAGAVKTIYSHDGGLSSLPLIYAQSNGSYHGLLIDVVNPTEVRVTDDNQVVVRSITKSGLKLHLFLGPEPKDVMRDVIKLMGPKKELDYWMLGAHLCSEIKEDRDEAVEYLEAYITNATDIDLPYESHCGARPIVFNAQTQTEDLEAVAAAAELVRTASKRFVPHVSPYVRFVEDETEEDENTDNSTESTTENITENTTENTAESTTEDTTENATENTTENATEETIHCSIVCEHEEYFLRENATHIYKGFITDINDVVVYPDYGNVSDEFMDKLWAANVKVTVDGIVLENNWPLDESLKNHEEAHDQLPYFSENFESAFNSTPQWNAITRDGQLYFEEHNKYGSNFIRAFEKLSENTPTWSSSHWMETGVVTNRQNIETSWTNLQRELVAAALGGISGHWLWTSPICGDATNFDMETHASLCIKWYMAATYFPMIKVHSKQTPRDPLAFVGTNRALILAAMRNRLALSPYFYTVLQEGPLLRPMFYQFPQNDELKELRSQFAVGDGLLIAPNLQPRQTHVHVRVPPGTWYEFWSGLKIDAEEGEVVTMMTTEADFLTFIQGGSIVPTQMNVHPTAEATRKNSAYTLVIATANVTQYTTYARTAEGKLYLTPNLTIAFRTNETELTISIANDNADADFTALCGEDAVSANVVSVIKIYGLEEEYNNYDNHRQLTTAIDLCDLETDKIVFTLY